MPRSIAQLLFEETYRFDFYKAVQLLEQLSPDAIPVGESNEPNKEPVKFHAKVKTDFSASALAELHKSSSKEVPPELHTQFMSLAHLFLLFVQKPLSNGDKTFFAD